MDDMRREPASVARATLVQGVFASLGCQDTLEGGDPSVVFYVAIGWDCKLVVTCNNEKAV